MMTSFLTQKKFDFISQAMDSNTFGVVSFKGTEGFSLPYEFEILLVAWDPEVDMTAVLQRAATFTILRPEGDIPFHGILSQFEQLQEVNDVVFYRAVLVPKLWWLSLTHHNQIFLDKTIPEIISEVLLDGGLTAADFELRLTADYPPWEYICQHNESHLAFVSRWMEREGMYYFFEQHPEGERIVITDSTMAHVEMAEGTTMSYSPPSGLAEPFREEVVHALVCKQRLLPKKLHVSDYNYRLPSLNLTAEADVTELGRGEVHLYGEHFRTTEEGTALAKVRAEELLCQEKRFFGESTIPFLRPGYRFDLQRHYRDGFNQKYLTTQLEHEGNQTGYLLAGLREGLSERESRLYYSNSFVAIPSGVQYRPPRRSEKPRFYGTINARIDAAGSGKYAELDDQGRYKVRLPFDLIERQGGTASHYLRMAQPYAGTDHGMHFPLHKGTEVLLTFVEGDPDRPIIAGAVPNPERPSVLGSQNQTMAAITTAGQNKIHFEDQEGKRRILMQSPTANSWVRVGAPNDPPDPYAVIEGDDISTYTDSTGEWKLVETGAVVTGTRAATMLDNGGSFTYRLSKRFTVTCQPFSHEGDIETFWRYSVNNEQIYESLGLNYPLTGLPATFEGFWWILEDTPGDLSWLFSRDKSIFINVSEVAEVTETTGSGIRIHSTDNVWIESNNRYAVYTVGGPTSKADDEDDDWDRVAQPIQYLWDKFYGTDPGFAPTGMKPYGYGSGVDNPVSSTDAASLSTLARKGRVQLTKGDTFNTQEGNIYDFGGYWNYNLGNSYAECFLKQKVEGDDGTGATRNPVLNQKHEVMWPSEDMLLGAGAIGASMGVKGAAALISGPAGLLLGGLVIGLQAGLRQEAKQRNVGDIMDPGGPQTADPIDIETDENKVTGLDSSNTWVEKKFGNSYSYYEGKQISITNANQESHNRGDTYTFNYGGNHEETKISGLGIITSWSKSGKGMSEEKTWDYKTGEFLTYEFKKQKFFSFALSLPTSTPVIAISIGMDNLKLSFALEAGMTISASASMAASLKFSANASMDVDIKFAAAGEFTVKNGEITTNLPGLRGKIFGVEINAKANGIKAALNDITSKISTIDSNATEVKAALTSIESALKLIA